MGTGSTDPALAVVQVTGRQGVVTSLPQRRNSGRSSGLAVNLLSRCRHAAKLWSIWREQEDNAADVEAAVERQLDTDQKTATQSALE